jgi:predicted NACHT family NTPase
MTERRSAGTKDHTGGVSAVAFSPDGKTVVLVSYDGTVQLWDVETDAALQTLEGHTDCDSAVTFLPDGKPAVSIPDDETVRLWDCVSAIAFSPDGKTAVSASWDRTVRLWDAGTGAALQTLKSPYGRRQRCSLLTERQDGGVGIVG